VLLGDFYVICWGHLLGDFSVICWANSLGDFFGHITWAILFMPVVLLIHSYRFNNPAVPLDEMINNKMFGCCVIAKGGKNNNKPMIVIKVNQINADGKVTLVDKHISVISVQQELIKYLLAMAAAHNKEAVELVLTTCPGMLAAVCWVLFACCCLMSPLVIIRPQNRGPVCSLNGVCRLSSSDPRIGDRCVR
jgi:hypothetical protein